MNTNKFELDIKGSCNRLSRYFLPVSRFAFVLRIKFQILINNTLLLNLQILGPNCRVGIYLYFQLAIEEIYDWR